jgi:hypothetical protein
MDMALSLPLSPALMSRRCAPFVCLKNKEFKQSEIICDAPGGEISLRMLKTNCPTILGTHRLTVAGRLAKT